jgi:hypothetical protein
MQSVNRPAHTASRRLIAALLVATFATVLATPAALAVDTYSISGHVIAGGVAQDRQSACFTLSATIGQAVIGGAFTSTDFAEYAGFWRAFPPTPDSVFSSSFENCGS